MTASHNPAKYNGYKAYGPDGCQMTDDAAAIVYDEIQKTDVLTGAKYMPFAQGVEEGLIRFVGDDCKRALYDAIEERQVRPGLCKTAGLKLVYSPLNGSGLVPVTQILKDIGITDVTIVPEQEYPNGYFTTCSYPNPEIFEALEKGLSLAKETGAKFKHVAYDGAVGAITDLLGEHIDAVAVSYAEVANYVESGDLKVLAVMNDKRLDAIPDVPTCKEAGYNVVLGTWRGLGVPASTPDYVVEQLYQIFSDAAQSDAFVDFMNKSNNVIDIMDGPSFEDRIIADLDTYKALVTDLGLKIQ